MVTRSYELSRIAATLDQSAAESAAGVTPTNYGYVPGDVRRYGAKGDGATDDSAAFASAALVSGTHAMQVPYTASGYIVNTHFALPANATMIGIGRPTIKNTVAGGDIVYAFNAGNLTIENIIFKGAGSSTVPAFSNNGLAASSTGLITLYQCTDVRVQECEAGTFYNGISIVQCTRVWCNFNYVHNWLIYGILGAVSSEASFDNNVCDTCDQSNGVTGGNYGIMATGNSPTTPSKGISISFNKIRNVPSWDGIMSHDCDSLTVIGNEIRNVRNGIDITYSGTGTSLRNLIVGDNYVEATTTDTWNGSAATSFGIQAVGFNSTNLIESVVISGNICRNFGGMSGSPVLSGNTAVIGAANCNDVITNILT